MDLVRRRRGKEDLYGDRSSEVSINFITCHDGFTMYDLVSYNEKHNEANGENNADGSLVLGPRSSAVLIAK